MNPLDRELRTILCGDSKRENQFVAISCKPKHQTDRIKISATLAFATFKTFSAHRAKLIFKIIHMHGFLCALTHK
jgi:hypothetical protein